MLPVLKKSLNDIGVRIRCNSSTILLITILVSIQFAVVSCRPHSQQEEKEKIEFYYYPNKNVYYNVNKKSFLYSLNGGKTWDSVINTAGTEPATLGEKIIVHNNNDQIYKANAAHRKMYNGHLYNIVDRDTVLATAAPEITEHNIQKKVTDIKPIATEEKQVKGLRKFLNKIFGKHKNKKEEE